MLKTSGNPTIHLGADERILLSLSLVNQSKNIPWLVEWLAPEYHQKNVYSVLSRLGKRNLIAPGYRITPLGRSWIEYHYPLLPVAPTPPTAFHAVILDVSGVTGRRRRLLFALLDRWRFGRLSRGVYLTPHDNAASAARIFISEYRLYGWVHLAMLIPDEHPRLLGNRVFQIEDRARAWRLILDRLVESERRATSTARRHVRSDLLKLLVTDPKLPPSILPEHYWMEEAMKWALETTTSLGSRGTS